MIVKEILKKVGILLRSIIRMMMHTIGLLADENPLTSLSLNGSYRKCNPDSDPEPKRVALSIFLAENI